MKNILLCFGLFFVSLTSTPKSKAFFEEPIDMGGSRVSTVHFHLVRALSRCVGFSDLESETIATWSQLVDSGSLESPVLGHVEQHFSTRGGVNDPFFHWPRQQELAIMKRWVRGEGPLFECEGEGCEKRRFIYTGLETPGHEAFGTYIHSVSDHFSHSECMDAGQRKHGSAPQECELDNHMEEFGPEADDHTYAAIMATYHELVLWAEFNDAYSPVLPDVIQDMAQRFVVQGTYWQPENRAKIAAELYDRCSAQQDAIEWLQTERSR